MSLLLPLAILLLMLPASVFAILAIDRVFTIEFEQFPEQWNLDGEPSTILIHNPVMPRKMGNWFAMQRCLLKWLIMTPSWVRGHPEAAACLSRWRALLIVWIVGLPLFVFSGLVAAGFFQ